jgi:hypothetical protein
MARMVGPLLIVVLAVAFAGRLAVTGPAGPDPVRLAAAVDEPCSLLTLQEMGVLVRTTLKDLVADQQDAFAVCSYLGLPGTGIDVIEVGLTSDDRLRAGGLGRVGDVFSEAVADARTLDGLGDEAAVLDTGVGEVWTRAGEGLLRVSVTRSGTEGDIDAAAVVTRAFLAKLGSG